jgi:hypothetical protein
MATRNEAQDAPTVKEAPRGVQTRHSGTDSADETPRSAADGVVPSGAGGAAVAAGVVVGFESSLGSPYGESLSPAGAARRFGTRFSMMVIDSRDPSTVKFDGV